MMGAPIQVPVDDDAGYEAAKAEWVRRFTESLVRLSTGRTPMTESEVRSYGTETGPSYFDQRADHADPEDAAETDFSYWEHE